MPNHLKLKNKLVSSMGKLDSIAKIVDVEHKNLGKDLRMLVLTDYIKKSNLNIIGTNNKITSIGVSTIFEAVRRKVFVQIDERYLSFSFKS